MSEAARACPHMRDAVYKALGITPAPAIPGLPLTISVHRDERGGLYVTCGLVQYLSQDAEGAGRAVVEFLTDGPEAIRRRLQESGS